MRERRGQRTIPETLIVVKAGNVLENTEGSQCHAMVFHDDNS